MIFFSEKENLIVLDPTSCEILARFKNGKCYFDEEKQQEIAKMKTLGYKFEEEIKQNIDIETENISIENKKSSSKNKKHKEVIL